MAGKKRLDNGTIQYVIKRAGLLPKPIYMTFTNEAEGDAYVARVEALLDKGVIPGVIEEKTKPKIMSIRDLVREYELNAHPSEKDKSALNACVKTRGWEPLGNLNAAWVDSWISEMKRVEKLAPATIRARVGAMARCTDWGMRAKHLLMPDHAFRSLPDGYASYTKADAKLAGAKREDIERDRRLEPGEYERILEVIERGVLPRKQGTGLVLEHKDALKCLFILAVESAMRLSEMYTLTVDQVQLGKRTVFLDKTKNGDKRQVPMSSVALATVKEYLANRELPEGIPKNMVFPWWNGDESFVVMKEVTNHISKLFHNTRAPGIFEVAGCVDLHFHDLRHTATCQLYERTKLTDLQIAKITGHKSMRMLQRYANLRGSDLANSLW